MKNKNNIMIITTVIVSLLAVITVVLVTGFMSSASGGESVISVTPPPVEAYSEASVIESLPEISEPESLVTSDDLNSAGDGIGQKVADMARALVGTPFAENGATPDGFDNSGFIYYVLRENGYITCPRTTEAQSVMGAKLSSYNEMKPGDLIFFGIDDGGEAAYGGIFVGNGKMIACLSTSMDVCEVDITTNYYTSRFFGAISLS